MPWEKGEIIKIEKIQSTESSSRIEGIITTNERLNFRQVEETYVVEKIIITKDAVAPLYNEEGILVMSIYDFLLNPDSMDI